MSQPEQKQCIQKRIRTWFSSQKSEDKLLVVIYTVTVFSCVIFGVFYGLQVSISFLTSWSAGVLGIYTGFVIDRKTERSKDERVKKDFLNLIRDELIEIEAKIPPQNKVAVMLYPEIWDSFVSSGLIRLLSSEQVTKLSNVYKFIKGTQYEAEWVRRIVEEYHSLPEIEKEKRQCVNTRFNFLQKSYIIHGQELSKEIEKILGEKWWS